MYLANNTLKFNVILLYYVYFLKYSIFKNLRSLRIFLRVFSNIPPL
jgi:hypothetical protein